jgi:hypothetical protein
VVGARVSVDGYGAEGVLTDATGRFVLRAHVAEGQQVRLRAEKTGVGAADLYHPVGRDPALLQLNRSSTAAAGPAEGRPSGSARRPDGSGTWSAGRRRRFMNSTPR